MLEHCTLPEKGDWRMPVPFWAGVILSSIRILDDYLPGIFVVIEIIGLYGIHMSDLANHIHYIAGYILTKYKSICYDRI